MKTFSRLVVASTLIVGLSGATALAAAETAPAPDATAQPGPHARHGNRMVDRFDANKDGVVTIEEALGRVDTRFAKIDANKDGVIDKAELTAYFGTRQPAMVDRMLKMLDSDNDGKITKAEFEKPARKRFALADLNDDGRITKDEAELARPVAGYDRRGMDQHKHMHKNQGPDGEMRHHRPGDAPKPL